VRAADADTARAANPTRYPMKEVCPVEHREEVQREPKSAEAPEAEPKPRRFRIVKLEERIAPAPVARVAPTQDRGCVRCTEPESYCI
jgi:hypothetical protein